MLTVEDLDIETHFVKDNQIISKDSKSQAKFVHGINLVVAKNYTDNLCEELNKGMREKAAQGGFPGHAPFGYRNNKGERSIEVDPVDSVMVDRMMELYATGAHTASSLRKMLKADFGKTMSRSNINLILKNQFYVGWFKWSGETWRGAHPLFVNPRTFARVQEVLAGHNRPKHSKRDIAFRGLMTCAHDDCMLTGDVHKEKYVYYSCTGNRGKRDLPRFKEEVLADRLGEPLRGLQVPPAIVSQIVDALRDDQSKMDGKLSAERTRLESRITLVRNRMDAAYADKLDGKISEDFWLRKTGDWQMEEQQAKMALDGLRSAETIDRALNAEKVFELANRAYYLYLSQDSTEKAKLLRMMCSNFSVDAVSATPVWRKPFDVIFKRAKMERMVGARGFEPPTPCSRSRCATRLRYAPTMTMGCG